MHIRTNFLTLVGHSCWTVITNGLQIALQYPRKRTQPANEPAVVAEPVPLESAVELSCRTPEAAESVSVQDENAQVMFSSRSHLSGVSVRMDLGQYTTGMVRVELYSVDNGATEPLRTVPIDLSKFDTGETEHLYWEPLEESKDRSYLLRFALSPEFVQPDLILPRMLEAKSRTRNRRLRLAATGAALESGQPV